VGIQASQWGRLTLLQATYLRALIESNPVAIVVLDEEHRLKLCNPAFERSFLYKQDKILGGNLDVSQLVHYAIRNKIISA